MTSGFSCGGPTPDSEIRVELQTAKTSAQPVFGCTQTPNDNEVKRLLAILETYRH